MNMKMKTTKPRLIRKSNGWPKKTNAPRNAKAKRPLTSYNMFYRFKREKVISLGNADRDEIISLVNTAPGLEKYPADAIQGAPLHSLNDIRRMNIRKVMEHNLLPTDTRGRSHRTNHNGINGAMSFLELGKLMNKSWQDCDKFAKSVFRELAEEGRRLFRQGLNEHDASNQHTKKTSATHTPIQNDATPDLKLKAGVSGHARTTKKNMV